MKLQMYFTSEEGKAKVRSPQTQQVSPCLAAGHKNAENKPISCSVQLLEQQDHTSGKDPRPLTAQLLQSLHSQAHLCSLPSPNQAGNRRMQFPRVKPGDSDTINTPHARRSLPGQPGRTLVFKLHCAESSTVPAFTGSDTRR